MHQQLSDSSISSDLAAQKVLQQLTDAQAVARKLQQQLSGIHAIAESAQADVEKLHKLLANTFSSDDLDAEKLQQQLAEAQIFELQKKLEQLHTGAGQMNVHLQAAQQSQRDAQVPGCFVDACHVLSFIMTWFCLFCLVWFVLFFKRFVCCASLGCLCLLLVVDTHLFHFLSHCLSAVCLSSVVRAS